MASERLDRAGLAPVHEMAPVEFWLARRFPGLSADEIHDAVTDAVLDCTRRNMHAADNGALRRYMYHVSYCNAANARRSRQARTRREADWAEQRGQFTYRVAYADTSHRLRAACRAIEELLPVKDMQIVFRLSISGERSAYTVADALGLHGSSREHQRQTVYRQKDRMYRYLRRNQKIREIAKAALEQE